MSESSIRLNDSTQLIPDYSNNPFFFPGGIFLDSSAIPSSIINKIVGEVSCYSRPVQSRRKRGEFLCLSLSVKGKDRAISNSAESAGSSERNEAVGRAVTKPEKGVKIRLRGQGAMNTTKHLCAGAVAAMVSRTCLAPLERLKLEYIVRGEKGDLYMLIKRIATTQGLRGFWKGNFVNILRTAPFKAINFCAYDTYRKQLLKLSGNEETTNSERFIAGAAAGITATVLCLPLDTIRTRLVAPGGELLGGVIGAFRHVVQNEGALSLYKGLLPSILSMAPSGAVFYGVYDILKSAYLHSPDGRKRIQNLKKQHQELNAFEQLELGPVRTLLHGAIAGACAEAATYPFEVVRRQLQLQGRATRLGTFATCAKIVEQGGVPALYAGLIPSLLQVLPSASISFFVYEFMKIVLKVG
ncbi:probable mitochondrial adenine nucleotide transporter BTL3 isoform X2 [Salvia miltiorrhiza]|uniref:probable mitochondrial adenine nucleotide transporter BTL3 isoform X2 n=1 Tax=Salvia miltiorrhiza TaxID=226208 RepID=UPI0025AC377E|nr:probable mitochondrial adenine nucleotide transporter BTL3 isoform X2 [Salvia miltiorrhiza]